MEGGFVGEGIQANAVAAGLFADHGRTIEWQGLGGFLKGVSIGNIPGDVLDAPGRVSFTGVRSGYGNTIEIDHGRGMKTRFAHLSGIAVRMGQQVAVGQRIGAMGSTGRSTGSHLHYEIWVNGRAQNPNRFLRANDYVQ